MLENVGIDAKPGPGLLCLCLVARFNGVDADPEEIMRRFALPPQPANSDLVRVAKFMALTAKVVKSSWKKLTSRSLPALARMNDGGYLVLAGVTGGRALVMGPSARQPVELNHKEFELEWSGELVLVGRSAAAGGSAPTFDLSWFLAAVHRYRLALGEVVVTSFFLQLIGLASPLFFQVIVDKVLVHRGLSTLDVLMIGLAVVSVFEVVLGGLRTYVFSHTTNRIDVELGARVFDHLLSLPIAYFATRRVGDSVARVRELETIRNFITGAALTLTVDLFFTVVFFAVMFLYSATLTWIVLASLPLYVLISVIVTPIFRARLNDKFTRGAENQAFLVETVSGAETVKSMAVEAQMRRSWEDQLAGYVHACFRAQMLGNLAGQSVQFVNRATIVLTLYLGAKSVIDGHLTVGELVAFNMLAARVAEPVLRIARLWQDFQQTRISVERLGDILNTPREAERRSSVSLPELKGAIRFEHVTFRYRPDGPAALCDLSLDIKVGEVIGVVGPSGSGKSTLAKLAQRLYSPEAGRVFVDGTDLSMIDPAWLRCRTGVVPQESVLFNRRVRDNIALVDPGLPLREIITAAELAGAHDFIKGLPDGYDTVIGERGASLSGGQRQRIAIARALISDPRILIFDEATSALDSESEQIIQEKMRQIVEGRTVLIIAHRLSTLRCADRIITLEHGRLVENGTHGDLIREGGLYARLYNLQMGIHDDD